MRLFREGSRAIDSISGPLVFVNKIKGAGFGELVTVETGREVRIGQVLQVDGEICLIQLFESTVDIGPGTSVVWIERDIFRMPVGLSLIGRILNGHGEPIDGGPPVENCAEGELPVTGLPINPVRRLAPHAYLETGISAIDLMNTLIRGQKLPIFSGAGLPASRIAVQIARQARVKRRVAAVGDLRRHRRYMERGFLFSERIPRYRRSLSRRVFHQSGERLSGGKAIDAPLGAHRS